MKYFPSENAAKEFTTILEAIDFLYFILVEIKKVVKRASLNHSDRAMNFSNVFQETDKLVIDDVYQTRGEDEIAWQIVQVKSKFIDQRNNIADLKFIYSAYYLPLKELMNKVSTTPARTAFHKELTYSLSKGIEFFEYIGAGYDIFIEEMTMMQSQIRIYMEQLRSHAAKILASKYSLNA
ncbi:MAG TPA: hypothetical protein VIH86_11675 [Puia sp.]